MLQSPPLYSMRYALCAMLLLFSAASFYYLSLRLISQTHQHRAKTFFREGYYGLAANQLKKADHYLPNDYKIQKELGDVYLKLGELNPKAKAASLLTQKSKNFYLKASELNPLDVETAYGLARGESRLEQLYQYLHPKEKDNPFQPLPYFKKAVRLRPNSILYNYALARFLYQHKNKEELISVVRNLSRIYPPVYYDLKKEAFWSPPVKKAVQLGLEEAIKSGNSLREAHIAISSMMALEKKWPVAISHYQKALIYKTFYNNTGNYFHLGSLYLKNGQPEEAELSFLKGLDLSRTRENDLGRLYRIYKNEGHLEELYQFYQQASRRFILSAKIEILLAQSLIDLKRYYQAQKILNNINQKKPTAEAYYWLAHIAKLEKDWDSMELAIQKATLFDPQNRDYHLMFSRVLKRLNKLERAEKEAGLAILCSTKKSPWLFNHRAWIRWSRKDYMGAATDWQMAINLSPQNARYYAYAAEAYINLGLWTRAMKYLQKASKLDPKNKHYQKRYSELENAK